MADITQWFAMVDTDRSGRINAMELQRALAMGNLHFSLATVAQLIRIFNADKTGAVTLPEFQGLHAFLIQMTQSFAAFDVDRSGSLSRAEVYQAILRAGFQLDQHAFEALFSVYDPDRSQTLAMAEFIAMTMFLRSSSAVFTAFDAQRQGRITLDFNQFVYAVAQTK